MTQTPAQLARDAHVASLIAPHIPAPGAGLQVSSTYLRQQSGIYISTQGMLDAVAYIRDHVGEYPYPVFSNTRGYTFYLDPERYLLWSAPRIKSINTLRQRNYSEAEKLLLIAIAHGDTTAQFILNQMQQALQMEVQSTNNLQQYLNSGAFANIVTH